VFNAFNEQYLEYVSFILTTDFF